MRPQALPAAATHDEPLAFFLDFAEAQGAAFEQGEDMTLLLLPGALQVGLDLPEEITATSDPEVAREDGAVLLVHGHPILDRAASAVLERGDAGCSHLSWPASALPRADELVARAREWLQVDHGKIEAAGPPPVEAYLPVLRVGILVSYAASLEDRFQEREEVWVDARSCLPLEPAQRSRIAGSSQHVGIDPTRELMSADLTAAVTAAHRLVEQRAMVRRQELSRHTRCAHEQELRRAAAYYEAALESIVSRTAAAPPERRDVLRAQAEVTVTERDRRLAEIGERFQPRHELQPFRLHLVGIPALLLPVHVRRGERVFPLSLTWILGGGGFAPLRCPHCGEDSGLVAGRDRLGCRACLPRPPVEAAGASKPPSAPRAGASRPAPSPPMQATKSPPVPSPPEHALAGRARGPASSRPPRSKRSTQRTPTQRVADEERLNRMGSKLATSFWDAVVLGDRWRRKATVPDSPMSALSRLYGSQGAFRAIGVPIGARALDMTVTWSQSHPAMPHTTSGLIATSEGTFPFTLRWAVTSGNAAVGEVLPHRSSTGALIAPAALARQVRDQLLNPPLPRIPLDAVAARIWEETGGVHGLCFVVRCLALWWQVDAAGVGETFTPAVMAEAVIELVQARAGLDSPAPGQSALWSPDPSSVREATDYLRSLTGQPEMRHW